MQIRINYLISSKKYGITNYMNDTETTVEKQYKPWQFKPGQSGNLAGRPKGSISITTKIKQMLEENPQILESLITDLFKKHPDLIYKQIDGMPKQTTEIMGDLTLNITRYGDQPTE